MTARIVLENSTALEFREVDYGSADCQATFELRDRILRQPLGLSLWHENLAAESSHRHFSLWHSGAKGTDGLIACLVIVPLSAVRVKLRQMAVDPAYQRQGRGQQLIACVEQLLLAEGVRQIDLHARSSAVVFYQSCGYEAVGEVFSEVGIDHQLMIKVLAPED